MSLQTSPFSFRCQNHTTVPALSNWDTLILWAHDTVTLWDYETMRLWEYAGMRPYYSLRLWRYEAMILCHHDCKILRYCDAIIPWLWSYDSMILWYYDPMIQRSSDTMILWYFDTIRFWDYESRILWDYDNYSGTTLVLVLWGHDTLRLRYYEWKWYYICSCFACVFVRYQHLYLLSVWLLLRHCVPFSNYSIWNPHLLIALLLVSFLASFLHSSETCLIPIYFWPTNEGTTWPEDHRTRGPEYHRTKRGNTWSLIILPGNAFFSTIISKG